jgi:hypothetical protein
MPINFTGNTLVSAGTLGPSNYTTKPVFLNGSTSALAAPSPAYLYRNGVTTTGMYWLNPGGLGANQFYIDFTTYPGKPMTMVIANRQGSNGFPSLTYANATGAVVNTTGTYDANRNFNVWVGLNYWRYLGNWVVQGCKGLNSTYVAGTHNVAFGNMDVSGKFKFAGWTSTYAYQWGNTWTQIAGSGASGLYNYHVSNGYSLTTFDNDQDAYGANCSLLYGNNPWWYGACWSGSYFGGGNSGGYADAPYWDGSGSLWYAYGAIYIAFDTATMAG